MQKILPVSGVALNSNLILLIPGTDGKGIDTYAAVFKFQSDSINTKLKHISMNDAGCALNSNLILLIQSLLNSETFLKQIL